MKLVVYLDFRLPSWLALRRIEHLVKENPVELEWHAFSGSLGNIARRTMPDGEPDTLAAYRARRARARQKANLREFERQCEMLELDVAECPIDIDAGGWLNGLEWVARAAPSAVPGYLDRAFTLIYREKLAGRQGAVAEVLSAVGCPIEGFADFALADEVNSDTWKDSLLDRGILSAPALVLDEEIFLGREHLPLISWMLKGRVGNPPV